MAKRRRRKSPSKLGSRPTKTAHRPWPIWPMMPPVTPQLQEAAVRLLMSRAESWGDTFRAMADIADQMEEALRKTAGSRPGASRKVSGRRRREEDW